jgi:hypothetical protein
LQPLVAHLAGLGVTANQVTITSLVGSLLVGIFVATHADAAICFGFLSVWLVLRMCLAAIDGTLAIDFEQKRPCSRRPLRSCRSSPIGNHLRFAAAEARAANLKATFGVHAPKEHADLP